MQKTILEIIGTISSLIFIYLLIKRDIWCWLFGIISSFVTIILLIWAKLYTESFLNFYYVLAGFYGWWVWKNDKKNNKEDAEKKLLVMEYPLTTHLGLILWGLGLAIPLGYFMHQNTDGNNPYIDSAITIFSFIATYLEAHRVRASWIYWIILNATSVILYFYRDLPIYALLMVIYTVMSVYGWKSWQKDSLNVNKTFQKENF